MAISSSTNRAHFNGNGVTTAFATGFPFFAAADLLVIVKSSAGVESTKTLTTHYTVSGGSGSTGTVTMLTAPASGETLTIINNKAALQEVEFSDNDQIPADSIEEGLDRLARIAARARDLGDRAVRLPDSTVLSTFDPKLPTTLTADAVLAINDTGNGFKLGPTTAEIEEFKDDAETAKTAAQAAQVASELARDAAQTARTNAETAETNAEAARDLALQYRNEAEGFKDDAEAAAGSVLSSIGPVGSSPNANGGTISSNTLTLQPADGTNPGVMTAGSQTLGGQKTWNGQQRFESTVEFGTVDAPTATGNAQTLALPSRMISVLADAALNSIAGITAPTNSRVHWFINASGDTITWLNASVSASVGNRINTGGVDFVQRNGTMVSLAYDAANAVWVMNTAGVVAVANGGTNSSTSLNNNRVMQSSGGAIVEAAAITASRALISDANGIPTHSATTATELGYVNGVTSAIQTQLGTKITNPGSAIAGALLKLNDSAVPAWGYFGPGNNNSASTVSASRDRVLLSGTGTYTVTLPLANSYAPGHRLILIKTSSTLNTITIARNGSDLIDLGTSSVSSVSAVTPAEQWDFITDGVSNWYVVAHITSTPWTSFTPTLNSNTGVANNNAWWRRVGDSIELRYAIIYNGAGANSDFTASPPSGLQIDTSKLSLSNTYGYGNAMWFDNGVGWKTGSVSLFSSVSLTIYMDGTGANFNTNTLANLDTISMNVTFPITGWYP